MFHIILLERPSAQFKSWKKMHSGIIYSSWYTEIRINSAYVTRNMLHPERKLYSEYHTVNHRFSFVNAPLCDKINSLVRNAGIHPLPHE